MAVSDQNNPVLTQSYTDLLQSIRDNQASQMLMHDGTGVVNVPTGGIRYSSSNGYFQKFDGTAWNQLTFPLNVNYVRNGTGIGQNASNQLALGVSTSGTNRLRATVDSADWGNIATESSANLFTALNTFLGGVGIAGSGNLIYEYTTGGIGFRTGGTGTAQYTTISPTNVFSTGSIVAATSISAGSTISASGGITGQSLNTSGTCTAATVNATTINGTTLAASGGISGNNLHLTDSSSPILNFTNSSYNYFIRTGTNGNMDWLNSGFTAVTMSVSQAGVLTASNFTATSDERLKENWKETSSTLLEDLSNVKSGTYNRIGSSVRDAGVTAQSLQKVLPEVITEDSEGMLSVAYGNAALVAVIEMAKELKLLKARIAELESK